MNKLKRIEGVEAPLYRGDPRLAETEMDAWLRKQLELRGEAPTARPHLYGADAGLCARRNVLLEKNEWVDSNVNAAGTAFMAIGVALENQLAEALRRGGSLVVQGHRTVDMPELPIRGKYDLVVFDSQDELAIIEVKTCGELPTEAKPTHLAQIQMYAAISGIESCWLTYISRKIVPLQPLQTRTFAVECGADALTQRLQIAALSRAAADLGWLPPQPPTFRKHTECHYCEFRDFFCWGKAETATRPATQPTSPLREATPGELVVLDTGAATLAQKLYGERGWRRRETMMGLLEAGIPVHLERRVAELLVQLEAEL